VADDRRAPGAASGRRSVRRLALGGGFVAGVAAYAGFLGRWLASDRRRPDDDMATLLDRYLPLYDARERYAVEVAATPEVTYACARAADFGRSLTIRALFWVRGLPARLTRKSAPPAPSTARSTVERAVAAGWMVLEERPGSEIVLGAVTQPWRAVVTFQGLDGPAFAAFDEPGYAKVAWNIAVRGTAEGRSILRTETRILTTDTASRARFRRYWLVFGPFIHLIRRLGVGPVKKDAERAAGLMG
jgi:hypothetical protein